METHIILYLINSIGKFYFKHELVIPLIEHAHFHDDFDKKFWNMFQNQ